MSPDHLADDTGPAPGSGRSSGPDIAAAVTVPPATVVDDGDEDELRVRLCQTSWCDPAVRSHVGSLGGARGLQRCLVCAAAACSVSHW
jgi:hypothetical protein